MKYTALMMNTFPKSTIAKRNNFPDKNHIRLAKIFSKDCYTIFEAKIKVAKYYIAIINSKQRKILSKC